MSASVNEIKNPRWTRGDHLGPTSLSRVLRGCGQPSPHDLRHQPQLHGLRSVAPVVTAQPPLVSSRLGPFPLLGSPALVSAPHDLCGSVLPLLERRGGVAVGGEAARARSSL